MSLSADDGVARSTVLTWSVTPVRGSLRRPAPAPSAPAPQRALLSSSSRRRRRPAAPDADGRSTLTALDSSCNSDHRHRPAAAGAAADADRPVSGDRPGAAAGTPIVVTGHRLRRADGASDGHPVLIDGQPLPTDVQERHRAARRRRRATTRVSRMVSVSDRRRRSLQMRSLPVLAAPIVQGGRPAERPAVRRQPGHDRRTTTSAATRRSFSRTAAARAELVRRLRGPEPHRGHAPHATRPVAVTHRRTWSASDRDRRLPTTRPDPPGDPTYCDSSP